MLGIATRAWPAPITTANDVCAAAADPCRIDGGALLPVADGAVLDFGGRTLEIADGGLDVGSGTLVIRAGSIVVRLHGKLHGTGVAADGGVIRIVAQDTVTIESGPGDAGEIDVSGAGGGSIELRAAGAMTLAGPVRAAAKAADGDGGAVVLAAGSIVTTARGAVAAGSGRFGAGGVVGVVAAGDVQLGGDVDAGGGSGFGAADVEIDAGGSLRIDGTIDAGGTLDQAEGDGGSVALTARGGGIVVNGAIAARASSGGTGGSIALDATGPITVRAPVVATGGAPDGSGGDVWIRSDGNVTQAVAAATIDAGAPGAQSWGGSIDILARGGATLRGLDVSGGSDGGDVSVFVDGALQVVGPIDAGGFGGSGLAGSVDLRSSGTATIEGVVRADAPPGELGGVVALLACQASVTRDGLVSAVGASGATLLRADAALSVAGRLQAGAENRLVTSGRNGPPTLTGTAIPAATIALDGSIAACGLTFATTSTTTTTTRTTTTRTTTSTTATSSSTSTGSSTSATGPTTTVTTTVPLVTTTTSPASTSTSASSTASATSTTSTTTTSSSATTSTSTVTTSSSTAPSTTTTVASTTTTSSSATTSTSTVTTSSSAASSTTTTMASCATCDDGDPCTIDDCRETDCLHTPLPDRERLDCRVTAMRLAVTSADVVGPHSPQPRVLSHLDQLGRSLTRLATRLGANRRRAWQAAVRRLGVLQRDVDRAVRRGQLSPADARQIRDALAALAEEVRALRSPAAS